MSESALLYSLAIGLPPLTAPPCSPLCRPNDRPCLTTLSPRRADGSAHLISFRVRPFHGSTVAIKRIPFDTYEAQSVSVGKGAFFEHIPTPEQLELYHRNPGLEPSDQPRVIPGTRPKMANLGHRPHPVRLSQYPTNIMRTSKSKHALKLYQERLANEEGSIFVSNGGQHVIFVWDMSEGDIGMEYPVASSMRQQVLTPMATFAVFHPVAKITSEDMLDAALSANATHPSCRFMYELHS